MLRLFTAILCLIITVSVAAQKIRDKEKYKVYSLVLDSVVFDGNSESNKDIIYINKRTSCREDILVEELKDGLGISQIPQIICMLDYIKYADVRDSVYYGLDTTFILLHSEMNASCETNKRVKKKFNCEGNIKMYNVCKFEILNRQIYLELKWDIFKFYAKRTVAEVEMSDVFFSDDRSTAVVYVGYICGTLCGAGKVLLLRKRDKKWKIMKSRLTWIS